MAFRVSRAAGLGVDLLRKHTHSLEPTDQDQRAAMTPSSVASDPMRSPDLQSGAAMLLPDGKGVNHQLRSPLPVAQGERVLNVIDLLDCAGVVECHGDDVKPAGAAVKIVVTQIAEREAGQPALLP